MATPRASRLEPARAAELAVAPLTYDEVGATLAELPAGYHHLHHDGVVGRGRPRFTDCVAAVLGWQVQLRAGTRVAASDDPLRDGSVADVTIGLGPLGLRAPVRVVRVVDEPRRAGFVYGTLPGHPERGEEAFLVHLDDDDTVRLAITAFSRPASLITRVGGPIARLGQNVMARRYIAGIAGLDS
ncbi:DUF1990 family protein [Williamsia deligens]|uniref:DUF1990 family protein n=1 Tax=Williamsia deligens TaxID=321325 RepID=A0ABW3GAW4_9NOCA|nr:DUF1990 domain-containing protein [Williamsia deligens]MCP2196089.1 Uncharacterized protein, UPF0548 family [Williamsia deligens]